MIHAAHGTSILGRRSRISRRISGVAPDWLVGMGGSSFFMSYLSLKAKRLHAIHGPCLKSFAFENTPQLQIRSGAGEGMDDPVHRLQTSALGVALGKRPERRQNSFSPAVDLSQFHDKSTTLDPKLSQDFGGADLEHERLSTDHQRLKLWIRQGEDLFGCVTLDLNLSPHVAPIAEDDQRVRKTQGCGGLPDLRGGSAAFDLLPVYFRLPPSP